MKRIVLRYISLPVLLIALLTGCYKDKGNYTYHDINEITVILPGLKHHQDTILNHGDTLRLTPEIIQTMAQHENALKFEWGIFENSGANLAAPPAVIANTRNLEVPLTEPNFSLGGEYRLTLKVTDTITRVSAFAMINLKVLNRFSQGWIFLEDLPGGGDFSMLLPNGTLVHNVYSSLNPGIPMGNGKPVKIDLTTFNVDDGMGPYTQKIFLCNENSGVELDFQKMTRMWNFDMLFFNPPATIQPLTLNWFSAAGTTSGSLGVFIDKNGKVYSAMAGGFPGQKKFGAILLTPEGTPDYTATRYVLHARNYPFIYDNQQQRFYIVGNAALTGFPANASTVADLNNVGMELMYMDKANVEYTFNAVLKDNTNTPHLLRLQSVTSSPEVTVFIQPMNAPDIIHHTAMVSSAVSPHIFYGVGNQLYRHETTSNTTVPVFTFPAGEELIFLKFGPGNTMAAATWNGTESKVYLFKISLMGEMENGTYSEVHGGFGRIVDIAYKQ